MFGFLFVGFFFFKILNKTSPAVSILAINSELVFCIRLGYTLNSALYVSYVPNFQPTTVAHSRVVFFLSIFSTNWLNIKMFEYDNKVAKKMFFFYYTRYSGCEYKYNMYLKINEINPHENNIFISNKRRLWRLDNRNNVARLWRFTLS